MRNLLIIIALAFVLLSCEEQTDIMPAPNKNEQIAVDGLITNKMGRHQVKLSYISQLPNEPSIPVTGAAVLISTSDTTSMLTESEDEPGTYETNLTFKASLLTTYTLLITYKGEVYTAKAKMVVGLPILKTPTIKIKNNGLYHITWVARAYNANHPAMYEIKLNWGHLPAYKNLPENKTSAVLYYYSLPSIDVTEILMPEIESVEFPAGTILVEKRYSLAPEHAEFVRCLLLETAWKGGLFDTAPANLPTNLSQGAIGFFGACYITTASLVVLPK